MEQMMAWRKGGIFMNNWNDRGFLNNLSNFKVNIVGMLCEAARSI